MKAVRAKQRSSIEPLEHRSLLASIYVDVNSPAGAPTGAGWGSAFKDLQQALSVAAAGDEIRVADGTYRPTATTDRTISFVLKNGVSVVGGYAGYGAVHPDARDTGQFISVLSGDINVLGTRTDNSYHVLVASATNSTAILDGFTITAGYADNTSQSQTLQGGGIYMAAGSSPTVRNCTFTDNRAQVGNAISCAQSLPTISNCTFDGNVGAATGGSTSGGAIAGAANITDCIFRNNNGGSFGGAINNGSGGQIVRCSFENNSASTGGAIWSQSSTVIVTDCIFTANSASGSIGGGAIYCNGGSLTATGCTFRENQSSNALGTAGGAIYVQLAPATISRCSFVRNRGLNGAGIYLASNTAPQPSITNCMFNGNRAVTTSFNGNGGGVYVAAGTPTIANCTFVGNFAGSGGGFYTWISNSSPSVINCDFIANTASSAGGAIYNNSNTQTTFNLINSIVRGNSAPSGPQMASWWGGSPASVSFSNIQGGGGTIDADALFVRNPTPGADSLWGTTDDDYGDLRLQAASPCIDNASNAKVPAGVTTDLGGHARIIDFPSAPGGAVVDMGPYERGLDVSATGSNNGDTFYLQQTANGATLQLFAGASPSGSPIASWTANALESISIDTAAGDDVLFIDAANALPAAEIRFLAGANNDTSRLLGTRSNDDLIVRPGGQLALATTVITPLSSEATLLDSAPASAVTLRSLSASDAIAVASGKSLVLTLASLTITGAGKLDLRDASMLIYYPAASPIGHWTGTQYDGVTGLLQTGRNEGTWDGSGIISSMIDVGDGVMRTLGIGEASDVLGISGSETAIWNGVTVDAGCVIVKYTYAGDIDLNGEINGDDYFRLDSNILQSGALFGYYNGDINLDGEINGDDYFWLDSNITAQGPPL